MSIVSAPRTYKIPDWFLNRQRDHKDGKFSQLTASALDTKFREDLERLKKIRSVLCPPPLSRGVVGKGVPRGFREPPPPPGPWM